MINHYAERTNNRNEIRYAVSYSPSFLRDGRAVECYFIRPLIRMEQKAEPLYWKEVYTSIDILDHNLICKLCRLEPPPGTSGTSSGIAWDVNDPGYPSNGGSGGHRQSSTHTALREPDNSSQAANGRDTAGYACKLSVPTVSKYPSSEVMATSAWLRLRMRILASGAVRYSRRRVRFPEYIRESSRANDEEANLLLRYGRCS